MAYMPCACACFVCVGVVAIIAAMRRIPSDANRCTRTSGYTHTQHARRHTKIFANYSTAQISQSTLVKCAMRLFASVPARSFAPSPSAVGVRSVRLP